MSLNSMDEYWVPEHVKDYLRGLGSVLPLDGGVAGVVQADGVRWTPGDRYSEAFAARAGRWTVRARTSA